VRVSAGLVASWAFAVLIGTVSDRTTSQPLPGVTVSAGAVHATSRADGTFRLTGLKPGRATLSVSSDDVPPQQFPVTVGNTTSHVDLRVCSTTLDYNCGPPQ
jgi:Carboxypeptidase regulatory-like domain